jgi:hypothetical protein
MNKIIGIKSNLAYYVLLSTKSEEVRDLNKKGVGDI